LFFKRKLQGEELQLNLFIREKFGIKPKKMDLYVQAFRHKSVAKILSTGIKNSNERLEFLGDSVISTIVSEFLYENFPDKEEGYLTQLRSKIVSRTTLNKLGNDLEFEPHIKYLKGNFPYKSLLGNVFEAVFGAIYIDQGYKIAKQVFIREIIQKHIDLTNLDATKVDFKSKLLIYCQKNKLELDFRAENEEVIDGTIHFTMGVYINNEFKEKSTALSKRNAEKLAAEKVYKSII